jgi:hypothetical protein
MFGGLGGDLHTFGLTLYTDTHVVRGSIETRQRRISDILNAEESEFVVISDASFDDFGTTSSPMHAEYAQINLASVLFAVATERVDPVPELRTPKVIELAMISIPPFKVIGRIHLMPERNLRQSLEELLGRFIPVTDATFWSDKVGEARQSVAMVAVNHARAQILAPYRETDPWAGLDRAGEPSARPPSDTPAGGGFVGDPPWPESDRPG